jgi:hypothetical protein
MSFACEFEIGESPGRDGPTDTTEAPPNWPIARNYQTSAPAACRKTACLQVVTKSPAVSGEAEIAYSVSILFQ